MKHTAPAVLVFHSHGVGQFIRLPAFPQEGETIWAKTWEIGTDGAKGSNVAVALGFLNIPTAFAGKVGTDIWGQMGLEWLNKAHVDYSHLLKDPSISTQIGIVLTNDAGENSIVLGGDAAFFTEDEIKNVFDAYKDTKYLITGFEMELSSAESIIRCGKEHSKYIILNPSPVPTADIPDFSQVDLLVLNHHECDALIRLKHSEPIDSYESQLKQLRELYLCHNIILTLGEGGCIVLENDTFTFIPAFSVNTVDTSGAGDSFISALTCGLCHQLSLSESCRFASAYASLTVQTAGTFTAFRSMKDVIDIYPEFKEIFL